MLGKRDLGSNRRVFTLERMPPLGEELVGAK
jgi:hypothetical protein